MSTVSVIVPNYNHARFLRKRIDSILAQTYQDFELILLDDCSTDDSRAILREYASHSKVTQVEFNETNSGSTFKQWNKGVRLVRGKYVWIAESDDYSDTRFLERLVSVLDQDSEIALAYCRSWRVLGEDDHVKGFMDFYIDPQHPRWKSDYCVDGRQECAEYFTRDTPVPNTSCVVFRRAAYEAIGGADESLRISGDWKAWAAMALTGKIAYVSEPLNYYRTHETTVRGAIWGKRPTLRVRYVKERFEVGSWIQERVNPSAEILEKARASHAIHWVPLVASLRVPLSAKRDVFQLAARFDPHPFWRLFVVGLSIIFTWCGDKTRWLVRNALWHPILGLTRRVRRPLGLDRERVVALLRRKGSVPR